MAVEDMTAADVAQHILVAIREGDLAALLERCSEDVVFEFPFAPAGRPRRVEGKRAVGAYLAPVFSSAHIERLVDQTIHQGVEPSLAVIEFTAALRRPGGAITEASYVVILTVRDRLVTRYRDYWDPTVFTGDKQ